MPTPPCPASLFTQRLRNFCLPDPELAGGEEATGQPGPAPPVTPNPSCWTQVGGLVGVAGEAPNGKQSGGGESADGSAGPAGKLESGPSRRPCSGCRRVLQRPGHPYTENVLVGSRKLILDRRAHVYLATLRKAWPPTQPAEGLRQGWPLQEWCLGSLGPPAPQPAGWKCGVPPRWSGLERWGRGCHVGVRPEPHNVTLTKPEQLRL